MVSAIADQELLDRLPRIDGTPILGLLGLQQHVQIPPRSPVVSSKSSAESPRQSSQLSQALRPEELRMLDIPLLLRRNHRALISGGE